MSSGGLRGHLQAHRDLCYATFWLHIIKVGLEGLDQSRVFNLIVFCYKKIFWTSLKKLFLRLRKIVKADSQEFENILRFLEQIIQSGEGQNIFWMKHERNLWHIIR